jgi:hypothetical protein
MLAHVDEKPHELCSHTRLQPKELKVLPSFCPRCHLLDVTQDVAYVSSCLVFSDWHLSFRKIAQGRLRTGGDILSQFAHTYFRNVYSDSQLTLSENEIHASSHSYGNDRVGLAIEIAQICAETSYAVDLIQSSRHKFLGVNIDGILLIEYRAVEPSLQAGPRLILREGEFSLHGDRRPLLVANRHGGSSYLGSAVEVKTQIQPFNHFPGATLSVDASLQRDAIRMHYTFKHESDDGTEGYRDLEVDILVLDIIVGLESLLVTAPCSHAFREPLYVTRIEMNADGPASEKKIYLKDSTNCLWQIRDILTDSGVRSIPADRSPSLSVHNLYPVENNPLGQWASVAFSQQKVDPSDTHSERGLIILQRQACLACTRDQIKQILMSDVSHPLEICIIAAGAH